VGDRVLQIGERSVPFRDRSFDVVAAVNFLEHIEDDETFFTEMVRVLKPGGDFLFMAPKGEHGRPGFTLKRVLGFTADQEGFGHARDGYPPERTRALMQRHGLEVQGIESYCRLFTESLEDLLNYAYHRKAMQGKAAQEQDFTATPRRCRPKRSTRWAPHTGCTPRSIPRSARGPCSTGSSRSPRAT
jgi:SAM-dependent methyltransferase